MTTDNVNNSLVYYIALKNAGVPAEIHLYAQGRHAFGLRRTKFPIAGWPQLVEAWLKTIGMISQSVLVGPAFSSPETAEQLWPIASQWSVSERLMP